MKAKVKKLVELSDEDLDKRLEELRAELARLKTKPTASTENFKAIKEVKKEIARVLTIKNLKLKGKL
ncbi:MAG: 50S ribosomal protein L29 [Thermoproteota archaeon]|nr:50S ribosomal protein L29 [Candidatus Brockarchaeota archaeon]MBO3763166.1 50S ribosomal protein L29 [Candidatus Brockarchaeota archaeon]MBO3768143.1 50S ribosomal protein L29 [Candidatus Brockarchaeota archaeon]MBO3801058.1 50S ribosomal protein L29 [Candidatus Brockarchaeota archaeon]